ncbi:pentapeptide repeat-containing protein [Gimesia maris]|uniref:pentapeptide repeat-containing protein n=1 Tax=Gimesia maris TaxID=122 RepID=UPI003A943060|tara:strand:+ start:15896 stop:16804 length:909 start_codon:yes stop_codon:yes gene_type:complete
MGNSDHWLIAKQGTIAITKWQEENPDLVLDLTWADLSHRDLSDADLSNADLRWANLSYSNLKGANLHKAKLHKANLMNANLAEANLSNADLTECNLKWTSFCAADLKQSDLSGSHLIETLVRHADLSDANLENAVLRGVDFSETRGCVISDNQQIENAKVISSVKISRGYWMVPIGFLICFAEILTCLGILAVCQLIDPTLVSDPNIPPEYIRWGMLILTLGTVALGFLCGSYYVTNDKGYPGELGILIVLSVSVIGLIAVGFANGLGYITTWPGLLVICLLPFFGMIILMFLPDRTKRRYY